MAFFFHRFSRYFGIHFLNLLTIEFAATKCPSECPESQSKFFDSTFGRYFLFLGILILDDRWMKTANFWVFVFWFFGVDFWQAKIIFVTRWEKIGRVKKRCLFVVFSPPPPEHYYPWVPTKLMLRICWQNWLLSHLPHKSILALLHHIISQNGRKKRLELEFTHIENRNISKRGHNNLTVYFKYCTLFVFELSTFLSHTHTHTKSNQSNVNFARELFRWIFSECFLSFDFVFELYFRINGTN